MARIVSDRRNSRARRGHREWQIPYRCRRCGGWHIGTDRTVSEHKQIKREIEMLENSDFDYGHHDAAKLHRFDGRGGAGTPADEFSDKGRADIKVRPNNPRFADNSMADQELDERDMDSGFVNKLTLHSSQLDRLHDILNRAEVTDQEIKHGPIELSDLGKHRIAGEMGISPDEIDLLIASLTQNMRENDDRKESLAEEYYRMMEEPEAGHPAIPFPKRRAGRYTIEPDALGNATVTDTSTGTTKFYRGGHAADMVDKVKAGADKDSIISPLFEIAENPETDSYEGEIAATSGTYNLPWKLDGQHGLATVFFSGADDKPTLRLESVRDVTGEEVELDDRMHHELLRQAREFIGHE